MAKPKSDNTGTDGKLLDTWYYEYEGVVESKFPNRDPEEEEDVTVKQVQGKKVAIELRLLKKFTESDKPPMPVKEARFLLVCPEADIKISGTDIETLRKVMWGKLDKRFEVKWEDYFLVRVEELQHYFFSDGDRGEGLKFAYSEVEKGTAWDGTLLIRKHKFRHGEVIELWPGEFKDKGGNVMACIPATPENKAALKEFAERIDTLRERLADLLRPAVIMKTLNNLSGIALLPKPSDDAGDR